MSRRRFLILIAATLAIASLLVVGCAPEAAPPAGEPDRGLTPEAAEAIQLGDPLAAKAKRLKNKRERED